MKKALFIDRDGTLITEPPTDYQVDSLDKLEFYPNVFTYLSRIANELDYELVMVTNQDGLGTASFPEENFWPAHNKMLQAFRNENIVFDAVHIDRTFEKDGQPTRKPGTALLNQYLQGDYDLGHSFVIGDRKTDMQLAENLGAQGILIAEQNRWADPLPAQVLQTTEWKEIYRFLSRNSRTAVVERQTKETKVAIALNLDGEGNSDIDTGLKFFDHMLEQVSKHGLIDLRIHVVGDLEVDEHHTIEDTAISLGEAVKKALGSKMGIERYGFCLPMDDCLAQVALDFSGRNWIAWQVEWKRERVGDLPTEMVYHFFKSFSDGAQCNLHVKAEGENEHHKIEAIFKAWAKAIKMAVKQDREKMILPTTKGML